MAKEFFVEKNFHKSTLEIIDNAGRIIDEYFNQGFVLTLRQLYYQFVSRSLIENNKSEYKKLGTIIKDARRAGLIDWASIEDRTRSLRQVSTWLSPAGLIRSAAYAYREDWWANQKYRPEVWIEKDALLGVIEDVCNEFQVPYFACRGNNSESEQYKSGKRFARLIEKGYIPIVLHLGDHDPNGIDMTRDNIDRLRLFSDNDIEVRRLALNMDQISTYRPPANPAKERDTRYSSYIKKFGTKDCWELDALEPLVIANLIRTELETLIDQQSFADSMAKEKENREVLNSLSSHWNEAEVWIKVRMKKRSKPTLDD